MMQTNKVAVVTGGSSGIGRETASALRALGCTVYELSRRNRENVGVLHIPCDVSDEAQVSAAVATVFQAEGRIDIFINNAGFGISGAAEFTRNEDAKRLLDVNLFGTVNGCKAVIPYMRRQGFGRIVNISSVAALIPLPFQAWYSVSKAAVSSYTAALQNEVRGFGISLCAVMPGDIQSGFTAMREKSEEGREVYGDRIRRNVARMEKDEMSGMSPAAAGHYIAHIAMKRRIKPEYAIGAEYRLVAVLARLLPCRLKSRIIARLYAAGQNASE